MTRLFALAFFLFGACLPSSAQNSAPVTKASSIAGTVVKEPGSEPLKKVMVQVIAEDHGESYSASTEADGHFRVENVAPGRYRVFIERSGFAEVNERGAKSDTNVFSVQAGQAVDGLLFRMLPTAAITGRITDEDGDPMSEVRVVALRKKPGKGAREGAGAVASNDLGEYRLAGLFPGQYWIVAMPPADFRDYQRQQKSARGDSQPDTRYINTYYPGTHEAMQASAVTLKAGDEMPINLMLAARTYLVRGIVTGIPAGQKLFSKAGYAYRVNADEIETDGQFEMRGVAPGTYELKASEGTETQMLTAHQDVSVVAGDVEGVKLVPAAACAISGHLRADSGAYVDFTQYVVNLRLAELPEDGGFFMSQDFFGENASVDKLGNFVWKNVNPGDYIVQVYGAMLRVVSI